MPSLLTTPPPRPEGRSAHLQEFSSLGPGFQEIPHSLVVNLEHAHAAHKRNGRASKEVSMEVGRQLSAVAKQPLTMRAAYMYMACMTSGY